MSALPPGAVVAVKHTNDRFLPIAATTRSTNVRLGLASAFSALSRWRLFTARFSRLYAYH